MSNRLRKSASESQFAVGAGRFQPGQLRQPHRHLPQIIERGEVDAPVGREASLQPGEQRLDVEHAVAQPIADDRVPGLGRRAQAIAGGAMMSPTSKRDLGMSRARARDHLGEIVDALRGARSAAPPAGPPRRSRPRAPTRRRGSSRAIALARSRCRKSRAAGCARRLARVAVVLAPGRLERLRAGRRRDRPASERRRLDGRRARLQGEPVVPSHSSVAERVALLEVLPGPHVDALAVVDLHVGALERELVLAAGDLEVDDRRVLAGVLAVDPDLGPGDRVDGDRAVAAARGLRCSSSALAGGILGRRRAAVVDAPDVVPPVVVAPRRACRRGRRGWRRRRAAARCRLPAAGAGVGALRGARRRRRMRAGRRHRCLGDPPTPAFPPWRSRRPGSASRGSSGWRPARSRRPAARA